MRLLNINPMHFIFGIIDVIIDAEQLTKEKCPFTAQIMATKGPNLQCDFPHESIPPYEYHEYI